MLRLRRYRVFVAFAVITVIAFYHFSGNRDWQSSQRSDALKSHLGWPKDPPKPKPVDLNVKVDQAEHPQEPLTPPPVDPIPRPTQKLQPLRTSESSTAEAALPTGTGMEEDVPTRIIPGGSKPVEEGLVEHGQGRVEVEPLPTTIEAIKWTRPTEHFPIPPGKTIQLPRGSAKPIPKIQYTFTKEGTTAKAEREEKLGIIKEAFSHAWSGYKKKAWGQDELAPVSGKGKNPFNGWGATLVDSLDSLWIMGFKDEFEEAVEQVRKIDFTTSIRSDIPVFETTIRYLGGLLAAYDVSGEKYKVLLEKAVELAEVLMGVFDTPNRMPVTYYHWKPAFSSQPHRASSHIVLSEMGSLAMEFTRLAQLTKEPKYYDAIARITDAFEEWQNHTRLPGMFPIRVDASGCLRPEYVTPFKASEGSTPVTQLDSSPSEMKKESAKAANAEAMDSFKPLTRPEPVTVEAAGGIRKVGRIKNWDQNEDGVGKEAKSPTTEDREKLVPLEKPAPIVVEPGGALRKVGRVKNWDQNEVEVGKEEKSQKAEGSEKVMPLEKPAPIVDGPGGALRKVGRIKNWDQDEPEIGKEENRNPKNSQEMMPLEKPAPVVVESAGALKRVGRIKNWDQNTDGGGKDEENQKPEESEKMVTVEKPAPLMFKADDPTTRKAKRQLGVPSDKLMAETVPKSENVIPSREFVQQTPDSSPECIPHGLSSVSEYGTEEFTFGSMSDSMYEYLPKQFVLLGGLVDQYQSMYERAVDMATKMLFFRPMIPDEHRDILISGNVRILHRPEEQGGPQVKRVASGSHLTCFVGGMYALGSKIFDRPEDLDIATKLTDGCVWAYESTTTGIMPESFMAIPCDSRTSCKWNETKWWEKLDPYMDSRLKGYKMQMERYSSDLADAAAKATQVAAETGSPAAALVVRTAEPEPLLFDFGEKSFKKRQLGELVDTQPSPTLRQKDSESPATAASQAYVAPPIYKPSPPPTHEEYVKARITEERIPEGMASIIDKRYILRPEAIESVFYMYRITGAQRWRDAGWSMFLSIQQFTRTELGHSAIDDVTKSAPELKDNMESFWLAETLKYFYLLFAEEDVVSLDDWVFNTEAHPFKRPN